MVIPRPFDADSFPFTIAFTNRLGGSSAPPYDSLDLAFHVGDSQARVVENRHTVAGVLGLDAGRITTCNQVHGDIVKIVDDAYAGSGAVDPVAEVPADALVTDLADTPLLILTADCVPVVITDTTTRAVAAVHAGRRGLVAGVLGNTVEALADNYGSRPEEMHAFIGPCVHACCYEVDEPTAAEFAAVFPECRSGRFLDLPGAAAAALDRAGLGSARVTDVGMCTCCHPDLFFSYRRNSVTGRQGAIIAVRPFGTFGNKR